VNKNSKGFVHFLLLLGIALAVFVGIGYYALKNKQIRITQSQKQTSISPTPTTGNTASWKTCLNADKGFSIKYPYGYEINPASCDYLPAYGAVQEDPDKVKRNYVVTIRVEETSLNAEQWIQQENLCPDWGKESPSCSDQIKGPIVNSIQFDSLNRHYAGIDTIVKHGNTIYQFSLGVRNPNEPISEPARDLYNQILSTFKFTD
jgi:hypothetical protein